MIFELSLDNYIEIIASNKTSDNHYCCIEDALSEIQQRNLQKYIKIYHNRDTGYILGLHRSIQDLRAILKIWDNGYDYIKDMRVAKVREVISQHIIKLEGTLQDINISKNVQVHQGVVSFDDVPDSWLDRCSGNGWKTYVDEEGNRYYEDGESVSKGTRACKRCGNFPTEEGHDSCIGELGSVVNACCGHGEREGYIQFDNDKIVRGFFSLDDSESYDNDLKMLESDIKRYYNIINVCKKVIDFKGDQISKLDDDGNIVYGKEE